MMVANQINGFLREKWLNLEISKIREIQEGIEGLTDDVLILICTNQAFFVDVDGGMDYLIEENIIDNEDEFDTYELSETDEEYITELYNDIVESWLDYFVIETNEDINTERLKEDNEYQLI